MKNTFENIPLYPHFLYDTWCCLSLGWAPCHTFPVGTSMISILQLFTRASSGSPGSECILLLRASNVIHFYILSLTSQIQKKNWYVCRDV